ncbi:MAG: hypothetical protein GQ570_14095 [Helicobacteraceae bacterium]|nr:hypothetical protein [Helicobacteraceae bacterium]
MEITTSTAITPQQIQKQQQDKSQLEDEILAEEELVALDQKEAIDKIKIAMDEQRRSDALASIPEFQLESATLANNSFEMQLFGANAQEQLNFEEQYAEFQTFLEDIGYEGGPIGQLSQEEASELVAEDGFFGVQQTSDRIADFVLAGAGDDEALLREGRAGILQGYDQAEEAWGDKLPDISKQTIEKAVEKIDLKLHELGFSILQEEA